MKNYTITVNGTVYDVTVEEGAGTGAAPAAAPGKSRSSQTWSRHRQHPAARPFCRPSSRW